MYSAICNIQIEIYEVDDATSQAVKLIKVPDVKTKRIISINAPTIGECVEKVNAKLRNENA